MKLFITQSILLLAIYAQSQQDDPCSIYKGFFRDYVYFNSDYERLEYIHDYLMRYDYNRKEGLDKYGLSGALGDITASGNWDRKSSEERKQQTIQFFEKLIMERSSQEKFSNTVNTGAMQKYNECIANNRSKNGLYIWFSPPLVSDASTEVTLNIQFIAHGYNNKPKPKIIEAIVTDNSLKPRSRNAYKILDASNKNFKIETDGSIMKAQFKRVGRQKVTFEVNAEGAGEIRYGGPNDRAELSEIDTVPPLPYQPTIFTKVFVSEFKGKTHFPEARVNVPEGYKVIGGGANLNGCYGGQAFQFLIASHPVLVNGKAVGWFVKSKDHCGYACPGKIRAYAIAIYDPNNLWDIIHLKETSNISIRAKAECFLPPGYMLVGGGASTTMVGNSSLLLNDSRPGGRINSWIASAKDHCETLRNTVTAYAIGIKPKNGYRNQYVIDVESDEIGSNNASVFQLSSKLRPLDNETKVIGGGFSVSGSHNAGLLVSDSYPILTANSEISEWITRGAELNYHDVGVLRNYILVLRRGERIPLVDIFRGAKN